MLPIWADIWLKIETELTVALSIREIFKKERKENPVCEANGGGSILLCTLKPGIHFASPEDNLTLEQPCQSHAFGSVWISMWK